MFLIPLRDGDTCPGQVIGREPQALNSATIALFDRKGPPLQSSDVGELHRGDIFSLLFVTRDYLDCGQWPVIGETESTVPAGEHPYEATRDSGFIGAKISGSAIVQEFVDAFYGLAPWDDWYLPDYLDAFLLAPEKKPEGRLVYCGRHPR